ncbi:helix-turn-helix domain-containing protein [Niabella terrae]
MGQKIEKPIRIDKLLRFSSPDAGDLKWSHKRLLKSHPFYFPDAACYTMYGDWGCMIFQHVAAKHFDIWLSYYDICKPCTFYVVGNVAVTECCFEVANEKIHTVKPLHPIYCGDHTYNFYYFSGVDAHVRFKGDKPITTLDIHCHPSMLRKLELTAPKRMAPILEAMEAAKVASNNQNRVESILSARVFREPQACTPVIKETLDRLLALLHLEGANADLRDLVYPLLHICLTKPESENEIQANEGIPGIAELCRIMQADLPKIYSITELCKITCMSRSKFLRAFQTEIGISPHAYYKKRMMDEAMQLVEHSTLSLIQIAEKTGFGSKAAFSRAFKRYYKRPPSHFRRK